jgi:hypothetical protein
MSTAPERFPSFLSRHRTAFALALLGGLAMPLFLRFLVDESDQRTIRELEHMGAVYLRDSSKRRGPVVELDLSATLVDDTGYVWRKRSLSDRDFAPVSRLTRLESLSIHGHPISDVGLARLAELPSLKQLELSGTRVTSEGVARLRRSRPELRVRFTPDFDDGSLGADEP